MGWTFKHCSSDLVKHFNFISRQFLATSIFLATLFRNYLQIITNITRHFPKPIVKLIFSYIFIFDKVGNSFVKQKPMFKPGFDSKALKISRLETKINTT